MEERINQSSSTASRREWVGASRRDRTSAGWRCLQARSASPDSMRGGCGEAQLGSQAFNAWLGRTWGAGLLACTRRPGWDGWPLPPFTGAGGGAEG